MPQIINPGTGMGGSLAQSLAQGLQGGAQNIFQNMLQMQLMQMQDRYKQEQENKSALEYEKIMKGIDQAGNTLPNRLQQLSPANEQQQVLPGQSQQQVPPQQGQQQILPQQGQQPSALTQQRSRIEKLEKALTSPGISAQTRVEIRKRLEKERELEANDQKHVDKETYETYKGITQANKASRGAMRSLDRMEELNNRGELPEGLDKVTLDAMEKATGVNWKALLRLNDAEEFEKLSTDMLRFAKEIFGNRLTNVDVDNFLKTVPDLSKSKGGRAAVIRNLKLMYQAAQLEFKTMNKIIDENGGNRPKHMEMILENRMAPQLDRIAEEFKTAKNIEEPAGTWESLGKAIAVPAIQTGASLLGMPQQLMHLPGAIIGGLGALSNLGKGGSH